jgi:hypothetical protein
MTIGDLLVLLKCKGGRRNFCLPPRMGAKPTSSRSLPSAEYMSDGDYAVTL